MSVTLYVVHTSHPGHAARLMLEHKRIEHKLVNLLPGSHAVAVRALGFRGGTVPAMNLHGRRVQGTRAIARALDRAHPERPLFPVDPGHRNRVEDAEKWADEVLQPVPRCIANWAFVNHAEARAGIAREARVPAPRLMALAGWPLTWYFARKAGSTDIERVRGAIASIPEALERVEVLVGDGTIGGDEKNAADFQIASSVRLLTTIADLAPLMEGRTAARFAMDLIPAYPTRIPAGLIPREWLPC